MREGRWIARELYVIDGNFKYGTLPLHVGAVRACCPLVRAVARQNLGVLFL